MDARPRLSNSYIDNSSSLKMELAVNLGAKSTAEYRVHLGLSSGRAEGPDLPDSRIVLTDAAAKHISMLQAPGSACMTCIARPRCPEWAPHWLTHRHTIGLPNSVIDRWELTQSMER